MELVHEKADRVLVLHEGKLLFNGQTEALWEEQALLQKANLDLPLEIKVQCALEKEGELLAT
jgi:energy-coupling factor transport system ATP-binding protein